MASGDGRAVGPAELAVQSDVLTFLLLRGPAPTTLAEVEREMAHEAHGPYHTDDVRCALRDLAHAGLLNQQAGGIVFPSVAAVHMSMLST